MDEYSLCAHLCLACKYRQKRAKPHEQVRRIPEDCIRQFRQPLGAMV